MQPYGLELPVRRRRLMAVQAPAVRFSTAARVAGMMMMSTAGQRGAVAGELLARIVEAHSKCIAKR